MLPHVASRRTVLLLGGALGLSSLRLPALGAGVPMRPVSAPGDGLPDPPEPPPPGTRPVEPWSSGAIGDWRRSSHHSSDADTDRAAQRDGVHLVGDSIATRLLEPLRTRLAGRPLAYDVWNGRPTAPGVDAILSLAASRRLAPTVVVVLGSNDIFDPWGLGDQIARVAGLTRSHRVLWVTPYVSRPLAPSADMRHSAVLGLALERAAASSEIELVRWFELLARSGERLGDLVDDGVHPSTEGAEALADLIVTTLS
ncbi:MAG: hypothetical protein Q4G43_10920 [Mobilicoccus sp.]|nr:hypothetical protein [Mobilicoccus sp.]